MVDRARVDGFYELLAVKYGIPSTVVIVSPNHFGAGKQPLESVGSERDIFFKDRHVSAVPFPGFVDIPSTFPLFTENGETREHGLGEHFDFVSKHFPDAKIMPVVLRRELKPGEESERFASAIARLPGNVLVLASVDFSHNTDEPFAKLHDSLSVEILRNGSTDEFAKAEVDCRNCLAVAKSVATKAGLTDFSIVARTSVDTVFQTRSFTGNTSHVYGFFAPADPAVRRESPAFFAFFGDTHLGRGFQMREAASSGAIARSLASFYEKGDIGIPLDTGYHRPLSGFDRVIANLETAVSTKEGCLPSKKSVRIIMPPANLSILRSIGIDTVDLANNHAYDCGTASYIAAKDDLAKAGLAYFGDGRKTESEIFKTEIRGTKYAFVGLNAIDITNDWDKKVEAVQTLSFSGYVPIVSLHWGVEYSASHTEAQQKLAYRFVDAGARLIIGHHPHVMADSEIYRGVPIYYSLGNFIFDQPFPETLPGLGVSCEISSSSTKCTELPYDRDPKDFSVKFR